MGTKESFPGQPRGPITENFRERQVVGAAATLSGSETEELRTCLEDLNKRTLDPGDSVTQWMQMLSDILVEDIGSGVYNTGTKTRAIFDALSAAMSKHTDSLR